jgi:membrane-associated protein
MNEMEIHLQELITGAGLWAIYATVFVESGLLIGFFLPGDTLLFAAGLYASLPGGFNIFYLIVGTIMAAILGDNFGYFLGSKYGARVFKREESFFFHKDHARKAEEFYKKYGPITIVLARFIPVIRAFAPVLAGVGKMNYGTFVAYNIIGGILWVSSMSLLGYYLGSQIPNIDKYVLPIILTAVIGSIIAPPLITLARRMVKNG